MTLSDLAVTSGMGARMLVRRYVTPRKLVNFFQCMIHPFFGNEISTGFPPVYSIDPSASCNLRCPPCPAGNAPSAPIKKMDFNDYVGLVDEVADYALIFFLYGLGEPFLHPELGAFIEYAHRKRIYTVVSTNGHVLSSPRKAEEVVKTGLDDLIITISGIKQETYERYHRNGRMDAVKQGISNLASAREKLSRRTPRIIIRYLEFPYNVLEKESARQQLLALGADVFRFRPARAGFHEDGMPREWAELTSEYKEKFLEQKLKKARGSCRNRCLWPWLISVVNIDGTLSHCTQYPWVTDENSPNYLGNVFSGSGFKSVWQSKRPRTFRHRILSRDDLPKYCTECSRMIGYGDHG